MLEPDPADAALDELLLLRSATCLIVTSWPGQAGSDPHPAPPHIREQMLSGKQLPFIREATQNELQDYGLEHHLFSPELTKYLTKDWGSW
ncbi:MAG TPA: hypothetical protein VFC03_16410 [Acidimicrobiales bacterium]|jgi:hypothetical protein|nr:hypothetical protein [Acidimicrobiales bacterium]